MKVPVKWLKDYVDIDIDAKELGDRLTLSGSKVEEVITTGDEIQNVVTGKIVKIEPHPDAEKLVVCQVDIGEAEFLQIVTGANNMKEQDIVPVALHGSSLPGGVKIKKGKLRGVVSYGMMCSEEELGIAGDEPVHGLMILPQDTPVGKDIKEVLGLNNAIIDFEITSNRPDCLSVVGIARETAATLGTTYRLPEAAVVYEGQGNVSDLVAVEVKDELCRRYMARAVVDVKIEPSPQWMQERLLDAGVRPINNIVDITNFVMLELGQPMHAFDRREITSGKIVVERAADGEKFTTLDEVERELTSDVLCIKDDEKTIGLAGIMGGLNSEIKDDTKEVIFECANFDGTNIRVSAQKLGLRTEASSRFEKDIDPNLVQLAMDRACHLVEKLNAGKVLKGTIDIYEKPVKEKTMAVDGHWVNKFLGTEIPVEDMKKYLDSLELKTTIVHNVLEITVPTFRIDINIKEDIAEEIARIYGYDKIPSTTINITTERGGKNAKQHMDDIVLATMLASGLNQSISYAFISPKAFDKINLDADNPLRNTVTIKNPLGEDYSVMRTTTIPSMMESLGRNYARNNEVTRLFEIGKVYIPLNDGRELPDERNILTVGMYGQCDYLDLKGIVENLLEILGIEGCSFVRESDNATFHPGKTAALMLKNIKVGVLGEIHPDVSDKFGLDVPAYVAELNLDILYASAKLEKKYKPLPKYPAVSRDMALIVDDSILVQEIEDIIKKQGAPLVESVKLFDIYKGKQIPEGKKSIAYAIIYRKESSTLTDVEVNKVHDKILKTLEYRLGAQLR
ncbi:phenylalanine--tRNA ligase subunit beta [Clostridium thermarum]|uniref:phenylalanine--tRNA ligase subunit beta n=1 Tax=Clostridium thermarum TaxID=1716543 RepID=UPI0013CF4364|nr:phenylalanine--tRNA ligase subunit beta [Clostridium thermarum]